jgi:hypothetical protein
VVLAGWSTPFVPERVVLDKSPFDGSKNVSIIGLATVEMIRELQFVALKSLIFCCGPTAVVVATVAVVITPLGAPANTWAAEAPNI